MEAIGCRYLVLHPGSKLHTSSAEAIKQIARGINLALPGSKIFLALETMSGRGSEIGKNFTELQAIIQLVNPELRARVGVCWDTCHLYAAGYDLNNNLETIIKEFEATIG